MSTKIKFQPTKKSRLSKIDFNNIPFGKETSDHMFVADYKNGKWRNARIVPFAKFSILPTNLTLHYGQAFFEGMKAMRMNDGTPILFRTDMSLARLNKSAERMCMPQVPEQLFQDALHQLIDIDQDWIPTVPDSSLYIRPVMFATEDAYSVRPSKTYRFIIFTGPVGAYYSKAVSLLAEETFIRAAKGGTGEAKCAGNYAGSLYPTMLANKKGFDQILWLDATEHKYVQEVGTMNVMFVIDGKVVTPMLDGNILRGITRDSIIQILRKKGFTVEERLINIDELMEASKKGILQEAFGVGTAAVVNLIADITYQGTKIVIPAFKPENISEIARQYVNKMRKGEIPDDFGWIEKVQIGELVN